ncbi:metallophosphoesterase family protein [Lysinibacillus sp. KU-BSD001]|uniref:metallophosphoesterase family protein n=1 Tax=Lysinibacillus sp. KU-BSD001 TaxID=3141328 RepID=UPI0036F0AB1C
MQYALLGDLHSNYKNTKAVLKHIEEIVPTAQMIGLGDLYECLIGKRKAAALTEHVPLEQATIIKKKFTELLTFPSIIGNQEERIAFVTGIQQFLNYEEKIVIKNATLMHGHQFDWNEHFEPTFPSYETPLLFFGHSHRAAIYINGVRTKIEYNQPIYVGDRTYEINVGAVVESRDWCLYDSEQMTVTFLQAPKNDSSN